MNFRSALLFTALAAALGGCASNVPMNKAPIETGNATPAAPASAPLAAQSQVAVVQAAPMPQAGPGAEVARSVFFAYDSYVVDDKYRAVVEGNAQYLSSHPAAHVQLQGNTDARGSREYNLALGQKRADAVMKGMQLLGASPAQMEAVSFGKEKPKALGDTEADYAQNRRVDLFYKP
jgi:peptidoglycan-associated lipoprotein